MSDNQPSSQETARQGSVMDIQRPSVQSTRPSVAEDNTSTEDSRLVAPPTSENDTINTSLVETTADSHQQDIVTNQTDQVATVDTANDGAELDPVQDNSEQQPEGEVAPLLAAQAAVSTLPRFRPAIIVAIVVAMVLSGVAIYAYIDNRGGSVANQVGVTAEDDAVVTPEEEASQAIQDLQQTIDSIIDMDIGIELPESELTDEALGL